MAFRRLSIGGAAALLVVLGCGGGGGGSNQPAGRAVFTIAWPDRTRLIPLASNAVTIAVTDGATALGAQTVPRPDSGGVSTVTLNNLPVGTFTFRAAGYPSADGSGVAQATAASSITIENGGTTQVAVSMASTVDHLEIGPANPSVAVGGHATLSVTARDSAGSIVLLWPSSLRWVTANQTLAVVGADGTVTGIAPTGAAPGSVQISVTEAESAKSASIGVAVTSSTSVTVSPPSATISVGDGQPFSATVSNALNSQVTWSVQEGAAGGTVSSTGQYIAPTTPGTYRVVATSIYDNSKQAVAAVTVQAGNANVTIQ